MKKLALLLVSSLLLAGCFLTGNQTGQPAGTNQVSEFTGNLMEAMRRNLPMKCTFTSGSTTVETYVRGEMMYSQTNTDGKLGYMVRKDGCNYIWGDQLENGVKVCMDLEASPQPAASSYTQGPDLKAAYRCLPTVVSDDKFNLPSNVQFTDMGQMMNKMMQNLPSAPAVPNYGY